MLVDQLVFVAAAFALGSLGLRIAGCLTALTPTPGAPDSSLLERILIAAPVAAAFAVGWTLALGLVGLSGSVAALAAGPIAAWAMSRWLPGRSAGSMTTALRDRWNQASRLQRVAALALAGAAAGCMLEVARQPGFEGDALTYHLADVVGWLHSGHAGAVQTFSYDFPVGSYPVTNEVLLSWMVGISRSFAPLAAWSTGAAAFVLLGLWRLLSLLRVPRASAVAALVAMATLPIFAFGINLSAPDTDLPAVAWLACAAALSAGAVARPALLGPALLAAGLGIGTKTTVAPLMAAVLLAGAWRARSSLRASRWWLAAGAAGALLVGGPWYLRNVISHGWPLWPFSSGPTGDPLPHAMSLFHATFLSHPVATVSTLGIDYRYWLAGGIGVAIGTLAVPLVTRSRGALLAAAVALASLLAWMAAPFTGTAQIGVLKLLAGSALRYLLPALGACAVAIAIAARDAPPLGRRLMTGLLAAASVGSLVSDLSLGYPNVPSPQYLLAGAAVGAAAGALVARRRLEVAPAGLRIAAALFAGAALTLSAPGWLWRESQDGSFGHALLAFMLSQPGFASGSQPVAFSPQMLATLAGPHLSHPLSLLPARESCERIQARLHKGWIVVYPNNFVAGITTAFDASTCLRRDVPVYATGGTTVYSPASLR
ncbi:MAG: hypothetical protein DLM64_08555 [Solirubrobacterales bacterium]|nr:MAG: hypothetical protein DLM64_08555 [Solirubrobacterales bacterium]